MLKTELNILMVEDNPGDQFLVTELLNLSGIKVGALFPVETIRQALEIMQEETIDIILLDLTLPDSSGLHSFKSIKEHASHIPIVILSGLTDMNLAFEAITLGAQDYLIKGDFDEKLLAKTVLYSLERMQSIMATEETLRSSEEKKQKEIADAVISAQENERQDIGRELHDNINQILTTSRLYLGLVKTENENDRSLICETDKLIDMAIGEIRDLSHSLILPVLHQSDLKEALTYIFKTTAKVLGLIVSGEFTSLDESTISDKLKLTIYRIVQEQLNNINKHAKAKKVCIRLVQKKGKIELLIKDDGVGFDTSKKWIGVGLKNIKTRASLFNGDMHIISAPGKGCELQVTFN